ncbi:hypothetical protein ACGF12_30065, partial [Kitasatospora sp. NPDC048296]
MTPAHRRKVLVICKGNHCRSPIAALIIAERSAGALDVRSAGTRNWHVNKPAHPLMIEAAAAFGYDLTSHSPGFDVIRGFWRAWWTESAGHRAAGGANGRKCL